MTRRGSSCAPRTPIGTAPPPCSATPWPPVRLTTTRARGAARRHLRATTLGELAPLTRDLPADDATGTSLGAVDRAEVAARFSKVIRSGRWVAGRRTRLTARFGALIVNLADAVLPGREITLEIDAFCGKLILTVPAGARDRRGRRAVRQAGRLRPPGPGTADGPVIRLVGDARFSKVAVHRGTTIPATPGSTGGSSGKPVGVPPRRDRQAGLTAEPCGM